jgi:hypothetical protein
MLISPKAARTWCLTYPKDFTLRMAPYNFMDGLAIGGVKG